MNQKVVEMMLRKLGLSALIVNNGREAVTAAQQGEFDLIFLDVQMAVLDGIGAAREIRKHYEGKVGGLSSSQSPPTRSRKMERHVLPQGWILTWRSP